MSTEGQRPSEALELFHDHLDECAQCREQPSNLCRRGAELLGTAGVAAVSWLDAQGRLSALNIAESLAGWAKCVGLVASAEGKGHRYPAKGGVCSRCGADRHAPSIADLIVHVANGEPKGRN